MHETARRGVCAVLAGIAATFVWAPRSMAADVSVPTPAVAPAVAASAPPLEAFFGARDTTGVALSPSGHWMAVATKGPAGRVGFQIVDVASGKPSHFIQASVTDDVSWFHWVGDDWLVFNVSNVEHRSAIYKLPGLMAVKRDGGDSRQLIARGNRYEGGPGPLSAAHSFLALGAPDTSEVLVEEAHWDVRGEFAYSSVKAVDVSTGRFRRIEDGVPKASGWLVDARGRLRLAVQREGRVITYLWADTQGRWRPIATVDALAPSLTPAYVEGDDTLVVSVLDAQGDLELRRFDFAAGRPGTDVLVTTPGFDGDVSLARERPGGRVLGLTVTLDATTSVWFDDRLRAVQDMVDAKLPDRVNAIQCQPCSTKDPVLVRSYTDRDAGQFLLYRPLQDKWQLLGVARAGIDPQAMGRMALHRTTARDGEQLPLWVTHPPVAPGAPAAGQPRPAVVLVHGGPHLRGAAWEFDEESQFLATRGYVVIQPEFRGSTGYGDKHYRAGFKQWGHKMQDDITDALRFAVAQGWVDPARVCIMGASYGGYATLMGLVKDPALYRCGVAFAAVSDPRYRYEFHWSDASSDLREFFLPEMMGDRSKDAALLAAGSAVDQAERIQAPLLLAHGDIDSRVPLEHAERMLAALQKHGKTVEWVVYPREGHGFTDNKNQLDWYRRVEAFLAKYLQPAR